MLLKAARLTQRVGCGAARRARLPCIRVMYGPFLLLSHTPRSYQLAADVRHCLWPQMTNGQMTNGQSSELSFLGLSGKCVYIVKAQYCTWHINMLFLH